MHNISAVHAIKNLSPEESKLLLMHFITIIDAMKRNPDKQDSLQNDLLRLYDQTLEPCRQPHNWNPTETCTRVHVVIGESFSGGMKAAIKKLGWEHSDKIISFSDSYEIGPLWRLHEAQGRARRQEWFNDHINYYDDDFDYEKEYQHILHLLTSIPSHATIMLWSSDNACEQAGLRYAAYLLRDKPNDMIRCDAVATAQRLFKHPNQEYDWRHSGEIAIEMVQEILQDNVTGSPLDRNNRNLLHQQWLELAEQENNLRIWHKEAFQNVANDHYDSYLIETIEQMHQDKGNRDFIKAARVIGQALGHTEQSISVDYLEYRLRILIYKGVLEIKGVPREMRYYSVRRQLTT